MINKIVINKHENDIDYEVVIFSDENRASVTLHQVGIIELESLLSICRSRYPSSYFKIFTKEYIDAKKRDEMRKLFVVVNKLEEEIKQALYISLLI